MPGLRRRLAPPNTSLQRTRRQSLRSFLLAAELDIVRCRRRLIVNPSIRRCLAAVSVILFASSAAYAAPAPETPTGKLASLDADRRVIANKEIWLVAVAVEA